MKRLFNKLFKMIAIIFFTVYCSVWAFSPFIVKNIINDHGLPVGFSLTPDSSIRYNPFTSYITITDLAIKPKNKKVTLRLDTLEAELHLHQLFFDTIYIAQFKLDGLYIPTVIQDSKITIAGIEKSADTANSATDSKKDVKAFAYKVVVPAVNLTDVVIDLEHSGKSHRIVLDSLLLENIFLSQGKQYINLRLKSKINQAPFTLDVSTKLIDKFGMINVNMNLADFSLSHAQPFAPELLTELAGKLSYASKFNIELLKDETLITVNEALLAIDGFHAKQDEFIIDIASQKIHSNDLSVALLPNTAASMSAVLHSVTDHISVKSVINTEQLINIENVAVNDISVTLTENRPNVTVASAIVNNSLFSQHLDQELPALATFKNLSVNNIGYQHQTNKISVKDITLSGLVANILLDENKKISTLVSLNKNTSLSENSLSLENNPVTENEKSSLIKHETSNAATEAKKDSGKKLAFSLDKFSLVDGADIVFNDNSVLPHYQRNVHINLLTLSAIDSSKPSLESLFDLQGKSGKYESFDVKGRGLLFVNEPKYHVEGLIKEVSLPSVSSYIKDALKFEIESGQLDLTVEADLQGEEIDGAINVLLRGIEFTAADNHEVNTVADQTSVPFNVALGMLKDSDGNVDLTLPLSGDTSSPSFGLSGLLTLLVKQATISAAKDYLITTFVPYASVMKVAIAAGEFALKLRINDLNYLPQQIELNAKQIEFSRQMSVMLAARTEVNVKLCAVAIPKDIGLQNNKTALIEENIKRLKLISNQRVDNLKSYMVDKLKVSSAKLLRCTSQVDTAKDAKARIEFVI